MPMSTRMRYGVPALVAVLLAAPAAAAERPKPKPTRGGPATVAVAQPRDARKAYMAQVDAINRRFVAAVKQAQREFKAARATATTAEAKNQAEARRKAAIAAATTTRQRAINALGPKPDRRGVDPNSTPSG